VFDPTSIVLILLLVVLVFFMFRNSRKRKAEMEALQSKIVPGAEVMTNFGLFGTLVSIDEENNVAVLETSPGSQVRVHRQTIARVVDPVEVEALTDESTEVSDLDGTEPEFGERTRPTEPGTGAKPVVDPDEPTDGRKSTD